MESLLKGFLKEVRENPNKIALIILSDEEERIVTYKKLFQMAGSVAACILEHGVKEGDRVAVSLERGEKLVAVILGILWTGAVYVPVNPKQPLNRRKIKEIKKEWNAIPYGVALRNQKYRIVSEGQDVAIGEIGKLLIGGMGLAKGYIGNEEQTRESFVMENGERWYHTGDLGYFNEKGIIIFVGRMDQQVKVNGLRIELGEVEGNIKNSSGEALLRKSIGDFEEAFKHFRMADILPNAQFTISYLTKTVKLPEWKGIESTIYPIKNEVSGKDMSYTLMCIENEKGDININVIADRDIYSESFNEKVIRTMKKTFEDLGAIDYTRLPLTLTQQYYIHKEYPDNPGAFNMGNCLHIKGEADIARMKKAIEKLYKRYDAFRMVFHPEEGGYFVLKENIFIDIPVYEARGNSYRERLKYAKKKSCKLVAEPILLSEEGMARFWIIKVNEDELVIGYSINHIISDGMSFALMEEALSKLYENPDREDMVPSNSFADFLREKKDALLSDKSLMSRQYWNKRMEGFCVVNNLPNEYSGRLSMSDFYDCETLGDIATILVSGR